MGCGGSTIVKPDEKAEGKEQDVAHANLVVLENKRLDFDKLMADEVGLQFITEFAASEFSDENMLFWKEAVAFKQTHMTRRATLRGSQHARQVEKLAALAQINDDWDAPTGAADDGPSGKLVDPLKSAEQLLEEENEEEAEAKEELDVESRMRKHACHIINTYLCDGAEMQVTLPDHDFKKKSTASTVCNQQMFDGLVKITHKTIEQDTFRRFRLTDKAAELCKLRRHLLIDDADDAREDANDSARTQLRALLDELQERISFERGTMWRISPTENAVLWTTCGTNLGNTTICVSTDHSLVGKAVKAGRDYFTADAYMDPSFNDEVDRATSFVTKTVMCTCLRRKNSDDAVQAVVQAVNKKGVPPSPPRDAPEPVCGCAHTPPPPRAQGASFTDEDAEIVRSYQDRILELTDSLQVHRLLF